MKVYTFLSLQQIYCLIYRQKGPPKAFLLVAKVSAMTEHSNLLVLASDSQCLYILICLDFMKINQISLLMN